MTGRCRVLALLGLVASLLWPVEGGAQSVGRLAEAPTLRLLARPGGAIARIEPDALAGLDRETVLARVPWARGVGRLEGVPLARLLAGLGLAAEELEAVDRRGHSFAFALADALKHGAFLAERPAGSPAGLGKRGPFWLVFPEPVDGRRGLGPPPVAGLVELRLR